jgi:trk system potassium uptake protein TrkA
MAQIAVFGLGQFGRAVAEGLTRRGVEVIAVDVNEEYVNDAKDLVTLAVALDSTDERALRAVGLEQVHTAIVTMGTNLLASILTTALLKKMGVPRVIVRSSSPLHERIVRALGVDRIINIERDMGESLATSLAVGDVHRFLSLALGHSLVEIDTPRALVGQRYHVNIVAIKRRTPDVDERGRRTFRESIELVPKPADTLEEGDILILAGEDEGIQRVLRG